MKCKKIHSILRAYIDHKHTNKIIFLMAFLESFISPISVLIIMAPRLLILSNRDRYILSFKVTLFSTVGSIIGYYTGYFIFMMMKPYIINADFYDKFLLLKLYFQKWGLIALIPSIFLPFPPYKLYPIAAGVLHIALIPFLLASFLVRLIHYHILPVILNRKMSEKILQYFHYESN